MLACLNETYKLLINELRDILILLTKSSNINNDLYYGILFFILNFFSSSLLSYNYLNFIIILSDFSIICTSGSNNGSYSGSSVSLGLCGLSFYYLLNASCLALNASK